MLTKPESKERIEALKKAKSHSERFLYTGGCHATSDDMFIAIQFREHDEEVKKKEKEKATKKDAEKYLILQGRFFKKISQ